MWLVAKCWGFSESYIPESELGLHERLLKGKEKQLGFTSLLSINVAAQS